LAKAIKQLAGDPGLREKLGAKGRAYAVQHWGKEKVLADFHNQLEQLIV
jgi:glycosyltransferase involved in cell wall biosynthesis